MTIQGLSPLDAAYLCMILSMAISLLAALMAILALAAAKHFYDCARRLHAATARHPATRARPRRKIGVEDINRYVTEVERYANKPPDHEG